MRKPILKFIGVLIALIGFVPGALLVLLLAGAIITLAFDDQQLRTMNGLMSMNGLSRALILTCLCGFYSPAKAPTIPHDWNHFLSLVFHYSGVFLGLAGLFLYQHFFCAPEWGYPPGFLAFPIAAVYLSRLAFKNASA